MASDAHPEWPLLVFDGDCGFCTSTAMWVEARAPDIRVAPWQVLELDALGLSGDDVTRFAWWLDPRAGLRERGHRAIGHALLACRMPWPIVGRLVLTPPFSWLGIPVYRLVARFRGSLPGATAACKRPQS